MQLQSIACVATPCIAGLIELGQLQDILVASKNLLFIADAHSLRTNVETGHACAVLAAFLHKPGFDSQIAHQATGTSATSNPT